MKNFLRTNIKKVFAAAGIFFVFAAAGILYASTITTILGTDTLSASRSVINTNFSNLNTDKMELSAWYATTTHERLSTLSGLTTFGSSTATSTAVGNLAVTTRLAFGSATTTGVNGINLYGGCFAIAGICQGTINSVTIANADGSISIGTGTITQSGTLTFSINVNHENTWNAVQNYNAGVTWTNATGTSVYARASSTIQILNADTLALGSDLTVANGGTGLSTFGGTNTVLYTTSADTLSSEAAFTYDPALNKLTADGLAFVNATGTSIYASASSTLQVLKAGSIDASGAVTFTTITSKALAVGTGGLVYGYATSTDRSFSHFATTSMGTGTTTKIIAGLKGPITITDFGCVNLGGGTLVVQLGDSVASSTAVRSTAGGLTTSYTTLSSNNSYTSGESIWVAYGSASGTVIDPWCSVRF